MTAYPEGWLARELGLCYANVSLITDYDVGLAESPGIEPVSHEAVLAVFTANNDRLRRLLFESIPLIGEQPDDICRNALVGARP
jgi:5'-methylthioadenosine phosphorylase